jgi:membrane protease YdiL (CAAX protease family)
MNKIYKIIGIVSLFILNIIYNELILLIFKNLNITIINNSFTKIFISITFIIIIGLIFKKSLKKDFNDFKINYKKYLIFGIKYWALGMSLMFIANIIISQYIPLGASNEKAVQLIIKQDLIYALFSACIYAPFVEELIFRKYLRDIVTNNILFIITSGLTFGFVHTLASLGNPIEFLYIIPYGIAGSTFAYIYVKTNNIFTTMSLHLIYNFIMVIASILFLCIGVGI